MHRAVRRQPATASGLRAAATIVPAFINCPVAPTLATWNRSAAGTGPGNRIRFREDWYKCYPDIMEERWRDMYHSYYPYMFDHGQAMSLYPQIPRNPREWQPGQLQTTYDAIREDKYDAFIRLRQKFPEIYQDTQAWDKPPPFGEFNMFYSVRFGLVGVKAFTQTEYDDMGNRINLTALWVPDNQIVGHQLRETHGRDAVAIGAMNVPVEFHKPYITAAYKAARVPVKQVSTTFQVTPDAFAPIGTKLDVRHFLVGQEVTLSFQYTDYGYQGVMMRHGHDGGPVWLGDAKWQRRPGSIGTEGAKRVLPGTRLPGQTGAHIQRNRNVPIYRIDYKHNLIYVVNDMRCDIGAFVKIQDQPHIYGKLMWSANRGTPPFPTFVPPADEDVATMATEDCQLVSLPLFDRLKDEHHITAQITQQDIDDARTAKPVVTPTKTKMYDFRKYLDYRRKGAKMARDRWKKIRGAATAHIVRKQEATRLRKLEIRRRVK